MWSYADSVELPDWSEDLRHLYWVIRVEGEIKQNVCGITGRFKKKNCAWLKWG